MIFKELKTINIKEDPIRPELDLKWRLNHGRKIFGLEQLNGDIIGVVCIARTLGIPRNIRELSALTNLGGDILVAYSLWSNKKGAGSLLINHLKFYAHQEEVKKLVTLSPLTEMARKFHLRKGAVELKTHQEGRNFEYHL
jgi:hypothetical protein